MEPVSWGVLAATTAGKWAVKQLAGTAWKEKVEPAFKKSGLDHELAGAYEAGFKAFVDALRGPFEIDDARDAFLREMFADDGFQTILAELPHARFEDVDTARALELFDGLGPPDATAEDFDFAWRSLTDDDGSVQAAAIEFFLRTGLRGRTSAVLDAFSAGGGSYTSGETNTKLSVAVGYAAAEDDTLLRRITEKWIPNFQRSRAFAAAAERRDEIRRESTSLADILGGDATSGSA